MLKCAGLKFLIKGRLESHGGGLAKQIYLSSNFNYLAADTSS